MIRFSKRPSDVWRCAMGTAMLASVAVAVAGCGRTPPTPSRQVSSAAKLAAAETSPPAELPTAVIRDDSVKPATLLVPAAVPAPAPRSEQSLAAEALSRIGPPAVPMLVDALRSSDQEVRRQACAVLMRMGPDAKEAVPELVLLLEDADPELRKMAATALGRIGPDAAPAVPALMKAMLEGESLKPIP